MTSRSSAEYVAFFDLGERELARVAAEVRVLPLVVQGSGDPVAFLPDLLRRLRADGFGAEVRPVPYRFQLHGDEMLVLAREAR